MRIQVAVNIALWSYAITGVMFSDCLASIMVNVFNGFPHYFLFNLCFQLFYGFVLMSGDNSRYKAEVSIAEGLRLHNSV